MNPLSGSRLGYTENDLEPNAEPNLGSTKRNIHIKSLDSGYLVEVGCQSIAVETTEKLLAALAMYLANPSETERKWISNCTEDRISNCTINRLDKLGL